jgi:RNA polymerase sigma-70 factor (ECF subfamily)
MSDEEYLKGCKQNSQFHQKALYDAFSKQMFGVCLQYCKNKHQAEDALQEGWLKVFKYIKSLTLTGLLVGWIRKIMVHTCLDINRKNNNNLVEYNDAMGVMVSPSNNMDAKYLLSVINKLPEGYKQVFLLFAVEGWSHKQIAEQLNIQEATSRTQYLRARNMLRKILC